MSEEKNYHEILEENYNNTDFEKLKSESELIKIIEQNPKIKLSESKIKKILNQIKKDMSHNISEIMVMKIFADKGYDAYYIDFPSNLKSPKNKIEKDVIFKVLNEEQRKILIKPKNGLPDLFIYKSNSNWKFVEVKRKGKDEPEREQPRVAKMFNDAGIRVDLLYFDEIEKKNLRR